MTSKPAVAIRCSGAETRRLDELVAFQGDLKTLSPENARRLRTQIETLGFSEPVSIWQQNGNAYILNGHQRIAVLKTMQSEGVAVPPIPVSLVEASSHAEAKRKVLALTSQFGEITEDGLAAFLKENDISLDDVDQNFRLPEIVVPYLRDKLDGKTRGCWQAPPEDKRGPDGIADKAGYYLGSFWHSLKSENAAAFPYMLPLPERRDGTGRRLWNSYSRTNCEATERIVRTYMRAGDTFYEPCCGWVTFASTAKFWGFSGKASDIWDLALAFDKKQIGAMPGTGIVEIAKADCRHTGEPDNHYDFLHCNPPFFNLESYSHDNADLSGAATYEAWIANIGEMAHECLRIVKPGGLACFVINDFRKDKLVVPMGFDYMQTIMQAGWLLHDIVVSHVLSVALSMRKHDYENRRTTKCHEYVFTFKKPEVQHAA